MHELLVNRLLKPAQEKVWLGELFLSFSIYCLALSAGVHCTLRADRPAMTIAVDLGRKATKQTKHCCNGRRLDVTCFHESVM